MSLIYQQMKAMGLIGRFPLASSVRDWPEDFEHENGNYVCKCCECKLTFFGHKRRVVCKTCSDS